MITWPAKWRRLFLFFLAGTLLLSACQSQPLSPMIPDVPGSVTSQPMPSSTVAVTQTVRPSVTLAPEMIETLIAGVDRERALSDLRKLAGEEPVCIQDGCHTILNRATGSQGLQWAKDYVHQELAFLGYFVEVQDWSRGEYADQNLVATKEGLLSPDETIYFVAHLDGYKPDDAERSPAADDDATGVVALLELARVLSSRPLSNTLVLLVTTGEEHGALGAESHVETLPADQLRAIRYAVSVEMLGYDSDNDGVMQLWGGDHAPSQTFANELGTILAASGLRLTPHIVTGCD